MITQIFTRTPIWVWALLALLVWLGYKQSKARNIGMRRITIIPAVLTALSIYGTLSAFGKSPEVLLAWLVSAASLAYLVTLFPLPTGSRFDLATRQFFVLGSWVPLALMMGIFINKYVVGVALSLHPELVNNGNFTLLFSALYGAFSGIFIGRALRLWRLTRQAEDLW